MELEKGKIEFFSPFFGLKKTRENRLFGKDQVKFSQFGRFYFPLKFEEESGRTIVRWSPGCRQLTLLHHLATHIGSPSSPLLWYNPTISSMLSAHPISRISPTYWLQICSMMKPGMRCVLIWNLGCQAFMARFEQTLIINCVWFGWWKLRRWLMNEVFWFGIWVAKHLWLDSNKLW